MLLNITEDQMAEYLYQHGPLAVCVNALPWMTYTHGVFSGSCPAKLNHCSLLVGYGVDSKVSPAEPYWIIKNSWGVDWGMDGYLWLKRGIDQCGITKLVSTAVINSSNF